MQIKSVKRRRMESSLKWLSRIFPEFPDFSPLNKKLKFYVTFVKMLNFPKKTWIYVVERYLDFWLAKFQVDISIFDKHIAQKPYPLMTSPLSFNLEDF